MTFNSDLRVKASMSDPDSTGSIQTWDQHGNFMGTPMWQCVTVCVCVCLCVSVCVCVCLCVAVYLHNSLPHIFEGRLHKLPHTVHLPCWYDEIVWLVQLQHQPHGLKETHRQTEVKPWRQFDASHWTLPNSGPDRQEANLWPLSRAFARTSVLTSLQRLMGHILWERRTEHSHRLNVLLAHTKSHTWPRVHVRTCMQNGFAENWPGQTAFKDVRSNRDMINFRD